MRMIDQKGIETSLKKFLGSKPGTKWASNWIWAHQIIKQKMGTQVFTLINVNILKVDKKWDVTVSQRVSPQIAY